MKKLIFLLVFVCLSAAVMANTDIRTPREVKKKAEVQAKRDDMQELRTDIREHKAAAHQVNHDLSHVRFGKAIHDHKAIARVNKKEYIEAKRLELMGVDHPMAKAKRQVKVEDDNRRDNM